MATPEDIASVLGADLASVLAAASAEGASSSLEPTTTLSDTVVRGVVARLGGRATTASPRDPDVDRILTDAANLARQQAVEAQFDLQRLVGHGTPWRSDNQAKEDERSILRFLRMTREQWEVEERQRDEHEAREAARRRQAEALTRAKRAVAVRASQRDRVNELHAADDERQWEALGFTGWERDVWISSGMPRRLAHVARACLDCGIGAVDLQRPVGVMTVVERLESGEAPMTVAARLRQSRGARGA